MAFKDPEKQNFSKIFVLLGLGLLLCLGWELYEEAIGRQPWIAYQNQFKDLELKHLEKDLQAAKAAFEEKQKKLANAPDFAVPTSMPNFRKRLAEAERVLESPSYRKDLEEVAKLNAHLDELNSDHRFVKADLDAAYYTYDTAAEHARNLSPSADLSSDPDVSKAEQEIISLKNKLTTNETNSATTQAKLLSVTNSLSLAEKTLKQLKAEMDKETFAVVTIEERIAKVKARPCAIQQIVISGIGEYQMVDRCMTCHQGIDRKDFESSEKLVFRAHSNHEELFKHHPIDKTGCITCHAGQGRALNLEEAHQGDEHWHAPLLKASFVQSSCVKCHADAPLLTQAINVERGANLFQTKGCVACHKVDKSPYLSAAPGKLGPELTQIASKVKDTWLVTWIQDPKKLHPRTIMPEFGEKGVGIDQKEAIAIASYLVANSTRFQPSPAAVNYMHKHQTTAQTINEGKELFSGRGCMGCHDIGNYKAVGPRHVALDGIGAKVDKTWIYTWLEDPKQISSTSIMPKFPLNNNELACLTDYLSSLKDPETKAPYLNVSTNDIHNPANYDNGRRLIKKYGCYSCHSIPGFENNIEKIAPELTDFAAKEPNLLFWGTKNIVPAHDRNWYTWVKAKLTEPKNFQTDRIEAIMPNFHLTNAEIDDIMAFLKTLSIQNTVTAEHHVDLKPSEANQIAGWTLVNHYGCVGCHSLYDTSTTKLTGNFHKVPVAHFGKIGPNLTPEGSRVSTDWLADFLRAPYKMRPYLPGTMPTFNLKEEDHRALVNYFQATATMLSHLGKKETACELPVTDPSRGTVLLKQYQCVSCHMVNGKELAPSSNLRWYKDMHEARKFAPDLAFVAQKLNPDWANRWIENPHSIMPDTTMPFTGLTREDSSSIRSYLASLSGQNHGKVSK